MADFQTHIGTSTALGVVYGVSGHVHWDIPVPTCLIAFGLCSVAGMLPDVDSDSGRPQREILNFAAAIAPMLMLDRFVHLGLSHEEIVLAGGCFYILVRFGLGELLRRFTVHRGMWHSLPAAAIAGMVAHLICNCHDPVLRWYKVGAVVIGYLTHLCLDELWSMDWYRGGLRFKSTFGTALKMFGRGWGPNVVVYGQLVLIAVLALGDPMLQHQIENSSHQAQRGAREWVDQLLTPERTDPVRR